jgi:hypothetical protein
MSFGPKSPTDDASSNIPPSRLWKRLGFTICVVLLLFAVYYPFSPAAVQRRNMRQADLLVPSVRARIGNDSRFDQIEVQVTTADAGSLSIFGNVRSAQDLASLHAIVATGPLPKNIRWAVTVIPPADWVNVFGKPSPSSTTQTLAPASK